MHDRPVYLGHNSAGTISSSVVNIIEPKPVCVIFVSRMIISDDVLRKAEHWRNSARKHPGLVHRVSGHVF